VIVIKLSGGIRLIPGGCLFIWWYTVHSWRLQEQTETKSISLVCMVNRKRYSDILNTATEKYTLQQLKSEDANIIPFYLGKQLTKRVKLNNVDGIRFSV
jgi:gluconate kinase